MSLQLITAPTAEPLTIEEVKEHLRVETTAEDFLIERLAVAGREHLEAMTGRSLLPTTWEQRFDSFPGAYEDLELTPAPLISLTSVVYVDSAGAPQTLSSTYYQVVQPTGPHAGPAMLRLAFGYTWPTLYDAADAVRVRFVAGYADEEAIPAALKAAMLLLIGDFYENRQAQMQGAAAILSANKTVDHLISAFRTHHL